ncbi:MAG: RloB domain-containing protein [Caulobacteraceae bacterium]|nr:RloB domain-containing protein [Caulobacteraceae bacterium]
MRGRRLPNLTRGVKPRIEQRQRLIIACEGRRTEPEYIARFAADRRNALVTIEVVKGVGVPKTIVRRAIEEKRRAQRRGEFKPIDQVWAVFDRDEHVCIPEAYELARTHGIHVAFSNPCFELWALLHFDNYGSQFTRGEAQRLLKRVMAGYDRTGCKTFDYDAMQAGFEEACERAGRLQRAREGDGSNRGSPYTDVDLLMKTIAGNGKPR